MKGDDLAERLLNFAVRVIRLVDALPKRLAGRHIGGQLLRAGTSPGANYEEGRAAESKADFIHKIGIARKEIRESSYWLRLVQHAGLVKKTLLTNLIQEAHELIAILTASVKTAKSR